MKNIKNFQMNLSILQLKKISVYCIDKFSYCAFAINVYAYKHIVYEPKSRFRFWENASIEYVSQICLI